VHGRYPIVDTQSFTVTGNCATVSGTAGSAVKYRSTLSKISRSQRFVGRRGSVGHHQVCVGWGLVLLLLIQNCRSTTKVFDEGAGGIGKPQQEET